LLRNITTLKHQKFSLLSAPPSGAEFQVPRELAYIIAESLYGSKYILDSRETLEELINNAHTKGLFSYRVQVL